jgi:SAM-dependent methyltransferase
MMTFRVGTGDRSPCRYEVSYFALKRANPAEQPRELSDHISMSAPGSAQPREPEVVSGMASVLGADATRRKIHEVFDGRDQRRLRLLDVGCGTGRFLDFVKQPWRRLPAVGPDMSEAYGKEAKRHLWRWSRINFVVGSGE